MGGGLARILLELNWFVLPATIACILTYPVSAINITFQRTEFHVYCIGVTARRGYATQLT